MISLHAAWLTLRLLADLLYQVFALVVWLAYTWAVLTERVVVLDATAPFIRIRRERAHA